MIKIDYEKCIKCYKCIEDCTNSYIMLCSDPMSVNYNRPVLSERGRCIKCGHCIAICPQGAIEDENNESKDHRDDELINFMANKRTIRSYIKGSTIEQEKLEKIVYAAQTAPTDRNRKTGKIILIKELLPTVYYKCLDWLVEDVTKSGTINPLYKSTVKMANNREKVLGNAEYLVLFVGLEEYVVDAAIAAERMQLEAHKLKVATAYRGDMKRAINSQQEIKEMLQIKKNESVLVSFAMGYSDIRYYRGAVKQNRKVEIK